MFVFVCAEPVDPEDPNCLEDVEQRVFDGYGERSLIADLPAAHVWWEGPNLDFSMPVRVSADHGLGLHVGIGPLVFDEAAIELLRTAIAVFDAV
jgi:hypothetical protein